MNPLGEFRARPSLVLSIRRRGVGLALSTAGENVGDGGLV